MACLVNTWQDLEPATLDALGDENKLKRAIKAPVYAVGPLVRPVDVNVRRDALDWLDMQPSQSVIYVSFGSGGTLSTKQTIELAWGLELSQQRFIWVLRPPIENNASANIFKTGSTAFDDSSSYLPDGFLTRTHNLGSGCSSSGIAIGWSGDEGGDKKYGEEDDGGRRRI
ncbi:hypothetical protein OIU84_030032 [Salix udensis]|uniref:Uncharacterized protein n=1 Tax=Salix udensis TaxID=889485 RepID=A0AAD6P8D2_9ROSI|nr:hypothetical protein OIU84_030032 [Salix udensis]